MHHTKAVVPAANVSRTDLHRKEEEKKKGSIVEPVEGNYSGAFTIQITQASKTLSMPDA
jgi:hypothetical protein